MAEIVDVAVADLLLDAGNARLSQAEDNQHDAALAITQQQGTRLIRLAEHIVTHGLDPSQLPLIAATEDKKKRYVVLEGNRRVLVLKGLDTPSLVFPALKQSDQKKWAKLAAEFQAKPITSIKCSLLTEDEAKIWIILRHTGENEGAGLVTWGAEEIDRYKARHGQRSVARQVIEFVNKHGTLSDTAKASKLGIVSNLDRLLGSPIVRQRLGLDLQQKRLISLFPTSEVAKGLSKVVEDLRLGVIQVPHIYTKELRETYANSLVAQDLPNPKKLLKTPTPLDELSEDATPKAPGKKKPAKPVSQIRTTLIPKNCVLNINPPRMSALYAEASQLSIDSYPNAAAVLLRVFLELSIDHYYINEMGKSEAQRRKTYLDTKMTEVAAELRQRGRIAAQAEAAIKKAAGGSVYLVASATTFNQYVHNAYTHPTAADLRAAWDELQPLFEGVWK